VAHGDAAERARDEADGKRRGSETCGKNCGAKTTAAAVP
jgi:hypothetical protein